MKFAPFLLSYAMPAILALSAWLGGAALLATPLVVFLLLPVADYLVGDDWTEPTPGERSAGFDLLLRAWLPIQLATLVAIGAWIAAGAYTPPELIALAAATGMVTGGSGITIAHELMHRRSALDRALAEVLMLCTLYPWFCVEHVQGHHKTVATQEDPAFAPRGQTLYAFLPRTLVGGLRSAWRIESARVAKRKARGLADRRVRYALEVAVALVAIGSLGGPAALGWFVGQAVVAILLLETINYVEHYGLQRGRTERGGYERVQAAHSWNTPSRLTNWFLFNLQRHADHHAFAARPYDQLRNLPNSPTLPAGYPTMILLAAVPPLWFRVVDRLVDRYSAPRSAS